MVFDYFYCYDDGIVEFTFCRLGWFATTFIITTMEVLSLPFVDLNGFRLLYYYNDGTVEFTFCGLGWFATTVRLDFLRGRAVYHIV